MKSIKKVRIKKLVRNFESSIGIFLRNFESQRGQKGVKRVHPQVMTHPKNIIKDKRKRKLDFQQKKYFLYEAITLCGNTCEQYTYFPIRKLAMSLFAIKEYLIRTNFRADKFSRTSSARK